jgi:putative tricarboxylic transport membrane protein
MVVQGHQVQGWAEALEKNSWTPALLTGAEFAKFVDNDLPACAPRWSSPA